MKKFVMLACLALLAAGAMAQKTYQQRNTMLSLRRYQPRQRFVVVYRDTKDEERESLRRAEEEERYRLSQYDNRYYENRMDYNSPYQPRGYYYQSMFSAPTAWAFRSYGFSEPFYFREQPRIWFGAGISYDYGGFGLSFPLWH